MDRKIEDLTFADWWALFPGAYLCALKPDKGQIRGCIPSDELPQPCTEETAYEFMKEYEELNMDGWNIHFTPNGMLYKKGKNRLDNFAHFNAFFVDIDILETNEIKTPEDKLLRETRKKEILGEIFSAPVPLPTFTIETRNGFQLYWVFKGIIAEAVYVETQAQLINLFKADPACGKLTSMLRVPYFKYHKKGETGLILPVELFCSMCIYDWSEIATKVPRKFLAPVPGPTPRKYSIPSFVPNKSIWDKIKEIPVPEIIERISGTDLVWGQKLKLHQTSSHKFNILVDGQNSPNWIDTEKNMIFSNNQPNFCTIFHFLKWYGLSPTEVKEHIKKLFAL